VLSDIFFSLVQAGNKLFSIIIGKSYQNFNPQISPQRNRLRISQGKRLHRLL